MVDVGTSAPIPSGTYQDAEGNDHTLSATLNDGPLLLGIYKSSCQASKVMFPMLERIHSEYAPRGLTVVGVSQDSPNITRSFIRRGELTFPVLVEGDEYPISQAFDIQATPTVVLIDKDGQVSYTTMGFLRDQVNEIGAAVANALGEEPKPMVTEADTDVPMFVPG